MVFKNLSYSLLTQLITVIVSFGSIAILARLLTPSTFGIFALMFSIHTVLIPLVDFGLTAVYIKKRNVNKETKDVFFTLNIMLGCLYGLLYFALAYYLNHYEIMKYAPAFVFSVLIFSYNQHSIANLLREHQQQKLMYINVTVAFFSATIAIILAYLEFGIYALLSQQLANHLAITFMLKMIYPQRYQLSRISVIKKYSSDILFGVTIVNSRIINAVSLSYDKFLISNYFGLATLGAYSKAFELSRYPDASIGTVISSPILAFLARKQKTEARLLYPMVGNVIFYLTANILIFLIFYGDWVIDFLLGPQWDEAGIYLKILSLWGIGKVLHGILITIYTNERSMGLFSILSIAALLINMIAFFVGYYLTESITETIKYFALSNLAIWMVIYFHSLLRFTKLNGLLDGLKFFALNGIIFSITIYIIKIAYFDQAQFKFLTAATSYMVGMSVTFLYFYVTNRYLLLDILKLKDTFSDDSSKIYK